MLSKPNMSHWFLERATAVFWSTLTRPMELHMNDRVLLSPAITLAGLLACNQAAAASGSVSDPNYYQLRDTLGGAEIIFDKHLPKPTLTYQLGGKARTFSGANITVEDGAIGKLVTVTTKFTPDVNVLTLSFFIPNIKIPAGTSSLSFSSLAVITDHKTPFTAPPVSGVTEVYSLPVILKGVAKTVP
jgi:hypothetical protein